MTSFKKSKQYWKDQTLLIQEWLSQIRPFSYDEATRVADAMKRPFPDGIEGIGSVVVTANRLGMIKDIDED